MVAFVAAHVDCGIASNLGEDLRAQRIRKLMHQSSLPVQAPIRQSMGKDGPITGVPGVGRLTLQAIDRRDFAQIQINVLFFGAIYAFSNLAVDLIYGFLDPRIRQA